MKLAPLHRLLAPAQTWWTERPPRDRRILMVIALVVLVLVAYGWIWQPALQGITSLERDLPRLRAQQGEVLAMAREARRLREEARIRAPAPAAAPAARRAAVQGSLDVAGFKGVEVMDEGAERVRLRWSRVDYGAWAAWVVAAHRDLGARLAQVSIAPPLAQGPGAATAGVLAAGAAQNTTALPGQVRADVLLEWRAP